MRFVNDPALFKAQLYKLIKPYYVKSIPSLYQQIRFLYAEKEQLIE